MACRVKKHQNITFYIFLYKNADKIHFLYAQKFGHVSKYGVNRAFAFGKCRSSGFCELYLYETENGSIIICR